MMLFLKQKHLLQSWRQILIQKPRILCILFPLIKHNSHIFTAGKLIKFVNATILLTIPQIFKQPSVYVTLNKDFYKVFFFNVNSRSEWNKKNSSPKYITTVPRWAADLDTVYSQRNWQISSFCLPFEVHAIYRT